MLEEDLALANVALDPLGQARALYQYAAEIEGRARTEDDLAYLRDAPACRNILLLEQPNGDFAQTIARLFLHSAAMLPWWQAAMRSADATLAAIAAKAEKEVAYHLRHAGEWMIRLGDGTADSHARAQDALDRLWPFTGEILAPDDADLVARGVLPDAAALRAAWVRRSHACWTSRRWNAPGMAGCNRAAAAACTPSISGTCSPHPAPPARLSGRDMVNAAVALDAERLRRGALEIAGKVADP
jgi:phenylacetate-CoA oxygenase PaaI subunit